MRITFLAPRLPPAVCGVADHTRFLAETLVSQGVQVGFIHAKAQECVSGLPGGQVAYWDGKAGSLAKLIAAQSPDWLWVQLSGYGFSRWGAPHRLGLELGRVRRSTPAIRLAIFLHEVHCKPNQLGLKGPFLSPWQKYTVGKITRLSHIVFASNDVWQRWALEEYGVEPSRVLVLPIGSHIPNRVLSPSERVEFRCGQGWGADETIVVAFGSFGSQVRALQLFGPSLLKAIEQGYVDRLVCVGGECSELPSDVKELAGPFIRQGSFHAFGNQPAGEVAKILACCDFALCPTPQDVLEKSSAFTSCALAGLAVLSGSPNSDCRRKNLPVLCAETWDWRDSRSAGVAELRRKLRNYAETNYEWTRIGRRVLDHMRPITPTEALGYSTSARKPIGTQAQ